jgi:hypothetical protein
MDDAIIDLTHSDGDADADAGAGARARRAFLPAPGTHKRRRRWSAPLDADDVIDLRFDEPPSRGGGGASSRGVSAEFSCGICFCDTAPADGFRLFCSHVFCRDCLRGHIGAQVGDGLPDDGGVRCPALECRAPMTGADVAACTDAATAARFERLALDKVVLKNPECMGCARAPACVPSFPRKKPFANNSRACGRGRSCCPTPGCPFLFEWDADNRKLHCPLCTKQYCLKCKARKGSLSFTCAGARESGLRAFAGVTTRS